MKFIVLMVAAVLAMTSCQNQKSIFTKQYCKLERMQYQEVTETVKKTVNGNVEGAVKANGNVILTDKIKLDSIKASLEAGRKVFIDTETKSIVKVSEQFYEDYTRNRTALCALIEGASNEDFADTNFKKRVSDLYVDIVESFARVEGSTQKKK